jgi:ribosomal protein S8
MRASKTSKPAEFVLSAAFCPLASRWFTMVRISVLHDALKTMCNAEKRGKRQVLLRPASKVVIKFLQLMQKHGYIGDFEFVDDHRAGKIVVSLNGRMNKCGCISPRYDVGHEVRSWFMLVRASNSVLRAH